MKIRFLFQFQIISGWRGYDKKVFFVEWMYRFRNKLIIFVTGISGVM